MMPAAIDLERDRPAVRSDHALVLVRTARSVRVGIPVADRGARDGDIVRVVNDAQAIATFALVKSDTS